MNRSRSAPRAVAIAKTREANAAIIWRTTALGLAACGLIALFGIFG